MLVTVNSGRVNQNDMEKVEMRKAYMVHATGWATVAPPPLQSLHLLCEVSQAISKCE